MKSVGVRACASFLRDRSPIGVGRTARRAGGSLIGAALAALVPLLGMILRIGSVAHAQSTFVPEVVAPSPAVLEAASAEYLTEDERREFRVRHGIFDDTDLDRASRRALVALERLDAGDPAWADPAVPVELRLTLALFEGRFDEIVRATADLEAAPDVAASLPLRALRAAAAAPALESAKSCDDILAAVELGALRIRLDASAAPTYRSLLAALARARQQVDRLDPRVRTREAELLAERHVGQDAVVAVGEALALSPRCARAWRLAGELALDQFDFEGASRGGAARRAAPSCRTTRRARARRSRPFSRSIPCRPRRSVGGPRARPRATTSKRCAPRSLRAMRACRAARAPS
jgi:hypothetical protein